MTVFFRIIGIALLVSSFSLSASELHEKLAEKLPSIKKEQIAETPLKDIYSIDLGDKFAYVTKDGNYLLTGDLVDLTAGVNLSQLELGKKRVEQIKAIPDSNFIVFPAKGETKHAVTIFTDIDCTWCRRLHQEIDDYNSRGIEVRYLLRPRSGPQSKSWQKADSVFCSKDQNKTLTAAKQGQEVKAVNLLKNQKCADDTPTMDNVILSQAMGFNGTPVLLSEDGMYMGGYVPPEELSEKLDAVKNRLN